MKRKEILAVLKKHREDLQRLGVSSLALFGSTARDEAGPKSDVDLLVEVEHPMGLFGILRIQNFISQLLGGKEVDLVVKGSLLEELKDDIMEDAVSVI